MPEMTGELLEQMIPEPFLSVEAGDTLIIFMDDTRWDMGMVEAMGTYLEEWAPSVTWKAVHQPGFSGVVHIKAPGGQIPRP